MFTCTYIDLCACMLVYSSVLTYPLYSNSFIHSYIHTHNHK